MNVFDQKLYETNDWCYAIAASVDEPHLYGIFKCRVNKRDVANDSISYFLKIEEIYESDSWIRNHIHRKQWRLYHTKAERGQIKELNCFDLMLNMATFSKRFAEKFEDFNLVVPSIHIAETAPEALKLIIETIKIMETRLETDIKTLKARKESLELIYK